MSIGRSISASAAAGLAALSVALLISGCNSTSNSTSNSSGSQKQTKFRFDPSKFAGGAGGNEWLPLKPGTQWVRQGATDVGHRRVPHQVISTVTDLGREVDGVRAILLLDHEVDAGQVSQESLDYLAEDEQHNVWSVGSYTESFEGGRFVSVRDAWLAGVKGGRPGVLMPAKPRAGAPPWFIAQAPGDDKDVAQTVETGQSHCVPFKCFKNVLVVREGKASAPDNEFKYYAAGVGQIDNVPRSASQHKDVEKLVNLTHLSPRGLAEARAEARKLDRHARVTKPDVFGLAPAAKPTF